MNSLKDYINEKFQVSKDYKRQYTYTPKDKKELTKIIQEKIEKEGLGTKNEPLDLNDIDTSKITDMRCLFDYFNYELCELSLNGYFDISEWDVSNVKNMSHMFYKSSFNGNISDWNVSEVENMEYMFYSSKFNGNISDWNVNNDVNMGRMFDYCPLEKNPPKWYKS